jgi:hypothetical protein
MERPIVNRRAVVLCGKTGVIKVYLCDFSKATDVKNIASQHQIQQPLKIILNMDNLGFIGNIEELTSKTANGSLI